MSYFERTQILAGESPSIDAFSRWRTSQRHYRFDSQMTYKVDTTFLYDTLVSGAGNTVAHDATRRAATLTVSTGASDYAILQSHYYPPYTPGASQVVISTSRFGAAVANVNRRAGYFDANDGIFLEQRGLSGLYFVQRSSVSGSPSDTNAVAQADWTYNGINDPLDGSGPSGITLDIEDSQILVIDFQALYVGRVRVGFDIDGAIVYAHEFDNANLRADPYWTQASLPIRWEISNSAGSAGATMLAICASCFSEGGGDLYDIPGLAFAADNAITAVSIGTTLDPVISIRNDTTFNSITNRIVAIPTEIDVYNTGNTGCLIQIIYNGTLTGASFADVETGESSLEYDVAATAISGGVVLSSYYIAATAQNKMSITRGVLDKAVISLAANGTTPDVLTVAAQAITGTNTVYAAINWRELR